VFHCFACGAGGSVLDLVSAMEKCTIRQAAVHLQGRFKSIAASELTASKLVTKRGINPPLNFSLTVDRRHLIWRSGKSMVPQPTTRDWLFCKSGIDEQPSRYRFTMLAADWRPTAGAP